MKGMRAIGLLLALLNIGMAFVSAASPDEFAIAPDWYVRADTRAIGSSITAWNMGIGETGVRCICSFGAVGRQLDQVTFVVIKAPNGYGDTVGRRFRLEPMR